MIGMSEVVWYVITKPFRIGYWWYLRLEELLSWLLDDSNEYELPPYVDPKEYPPSEIVPRSEWGAREPKEKVEDMELPVKLVVFHHTTTISCYNKEECCKMIRKIQDHHMDEDDFPDIGYNFLIGGDARVYEGRGWNKEGAHTEGWNEKSIGVAAIGDFTEEPPTPEMLEQIERLIRTGLNANYIHDEYSAVGHNQMDTFNNYLCTCPGEAFYEEIKNMPHWVIKHDVMDLPTDSDEYNTNDSLEYQFTDEDAPEKEFPKGYDEDIFGPLDPDKVNDVRF